MRYLRTNTATIVTVGPFLDKTDGVTLETALTITNERISFTVDLNDGNAPTLVLDNVTGATSGTSNDLNYITNNDAGLMQLELAAANVNYLGRAFLTITDAANHCPVFHEFMILPAMVYDSLIAGTDVLQADMTQLLGTAVSTPATAGLMDVNAIQLSGDATAANNAESFFDGTGYAGTNNVIPLVTTTTTATNLTNLPAAAATAAELAKVPKSDSTVSWNATALAAINAEVDTALNTAIPGSPTANSINERIATMDGLLLGTIAAGTHNPQTGDSFARIGAAGAGLTALPWNAAWDAEVQSEAQDAITASALATAANLATLAGYVDTEVAAILAAVDTEVSAIKTKTDYLPSATAGAAGGVFIAGANAATSITTALTANITGNLSGSVGSVTGAVGSVTGAVGSVTGAVGSVTGAVGSVTGNVGGSVASIAANGITATSIAADAINAAAVKADAVTKIQTGLATPTNITAGTITTVTNLTNAPTAGDLTATMKTSVTTAATAATPTAAAVTGAVGSVTAPVTAGTVSDKTGYALSSAGVQAIWDALTSALTTVGSVGKRIADYLDATVSSRGTSTYAGADTSGTTTLLSRIVGTLATGTHNPQTGDAYARIGAAGAGLTALGDTRLANLDATVSSRNAITPPTVGAIADQVWDEAMGAHATPGTAGAILIDVIEDTSTTLMLAIASIGTVPATSAIADAVWDEALSGHATSGTAGKKLTDLANADLSGVATASALATLAGYVDTEVAAILADTNELQTDLVNGGRLDLLIDGIKAKTDNLPASPAAVGSAMTLTAAYDAAKTAATQTSVDDLPTNAELAIAFAGADDAVLVAIAALNNLSSAGAQSAAEAALTAYGVALQTSVDDLEGRLTATRAGYLDNLSAGSVATASALATVAGYVDTEVAAILAAVDTEVAAIKAKTDNLPTDPADESLLEAAITSAVSPLATAASIAALNNISSAQVQTAATAALNAYDPPTNTEMEARTLAAANYATATVLDAVGNFVDTEVAAIKAVTDKLDTALVLDGAVYQLTANALELAPADGGGGGATAQQIWEYADGTGRTINSVSSTISANLVEMNGDTDPVNNLVLALGTGGLVEKLNSMLEAAGLAYRFTAAALAEGPVSTAPSTTDIDTALSATHGAGAWGAGTGVFSKVYAVTSGGLPVDGVYCRLTTDEAGLVNVDAGTTNAAGQVTFHHNLAAGTTVYIHRSKAGFTPVAPEPDVEVI